MPGLRRLALISVVGTVLPAALAYGASTPHGSRVTVDFARAPIASASAFASIVHHPAPGPRIVLAARARRVAVIHWDGERPLLVAPLKGGGFCKSLVSPYGGTACYPGATHRSMLNPGLSGDANGPIALSGFFTDARGTRLRILYEDGHNAVIPIIWVGNPINAGFFVLKIPSVHRRTGHRPLTITLSANDGMRLDSLRLTRK